MPARAVCISCAVALYFKVPVVFSSPGICVPSTDIFFLKLRVNVPLFALFQIVCTSCVVPFPCVSVFMVVEAAFSCHRLLSSTARLSLSPASSKVIFQGLSDVPSPVTEIAIPIFSKASSMSAAFASKSISSVVLLPQVIVNFPVSAFVQILCTSCVVASPSVSVSTTLHALTSSPQIPTWVSPIKAFPSVTSIVTPCSAPSKLALLTSSSSSLSTCPGSSIFHSFCKGSRSSSFSSSSAPSTVSFPPWPRMNSSSPFFPVRLSSPALPMTFPTDDTAKLFSSSIGIRPSSFPVMNVVRLFNISSTSIPKPAAVSLAVPQSKPIEGNSMIRGIFHSGTMSYCKPAPRSTSSSPVYSE